jgi:hypothetical protein
VLQGGTLSPILFCLYIDDLVEELVQYVGRDNVMAYADDIAIIFHTKDILARVISIIEGWS